MTLDFVAHHSHTCLSDCDICVDAALLEHARRTSGHVVKVVRCYTLGGMNRAARFEATFAHSAMEWGLASYIPGRTEGAKTRKRSERVRTYSMLAARAVFRAVPALRGER